MEARSSVTPEQLSEVISRCTSYREAARELGIHYNTVKSLACRYGVLPPKPRGVPPERVDDTHSRCSKCSDVVLDTDFPYVINRSDGRRLSYCRKCRGKQNRAALNSNPKRFWSERQCRIRSRAEASGVAFDLPEGYLLSLWGKQGGLCFYTDQPLEPKTRAREDRVSTPSVDKIIIDRGYTVGNVAICSSRANSIKSDQTLEELSQWMPSWHQRIVDMWRSIGLTCLQVAPGDF